MDFALFLLIFLAFHNSGQLLLNKICGLKFLDPGEAVLFSTALGSIVFSGIMTVLVFSGFINSAVSGSFPSLRLEKSIARQKTIECF